MIVELIDALMESTRWLWPKVKNEKELQRLREEAKAQFLAHQVTSGDARFIFSGADALVMKEDEEIREDGGTVLYYSLTIFARNTAGEYFMFVSNMDGKPFFKHVNHSNAKIVLGEIDGAPSVK
ncbi:hypothetical protein [Undibacterium sp. Xuan67W]|uniref:hypothetical protein n=1 Tax=Undibacterium sp. Xuan67W TaxID=3413057 RepID=UPI003BF01E8B